MYDVYEKLTIERVIKLYTKYDIVTKITVNTILLYTFWKMFSKYTCLLTMLNQYLFFQKNRNQ